MFRDIDEEIQCVNACFSRVFRQFLNEFSIFLKTAFRAEIPINRDRIFCIFVTIKHGRDLDSPSPVNTRDHNKKGFILNLKRSSFSNDNND